uniref:Bardet-Biedl syndrome 12 n=1 Tax=Leptobrachium leishanense TaxID=445787 RepID=A0A8C5LPN3_9ANUR
MERRGHRGLQELSSLTKSVRSFLGPNKAYKFIFNEDTDDCTLTCSAFRLLEGLDLSSAVGQLFNEAVQVQQKTYKTGTTTLFFLVGAWSDAVLECLHQGVPIPLIVSVMLGGLDSCIREVLTLQECVNNLLIAEDFENQGNNNSVKTLDVSHDYGSESGHSAHFPLDHKKNIAHQHGAKWYPNMPSCWINKLSHSRYFLDAPKETPDPSEDSYDIPSHSHTLSHLTKALSHGNQEPMEMVEEAVSHLFKETQKGHVNHKNFHVSRFHVCCLPGLSKVHLKASSGYTTLVSPDFVSVARDLEGKSLRVLLLDSDLTEGYRHLGFNNPTNVKILSQAVSSEGVISEEPWLNVSCRNLRQAGIELILVRGNVCPSLMSLCCHNKILVVPQVKQNVLLAFSESTGAEPVTYLTQINESCVGFGAFVDMCVSGNSFVTAGENIVVNIKANRLNMVTVMLCNRLVSMLQILEDQFWSCLYRLHHAVQDQKVFCGGGAVELQCLSHLRKHEEADDGSFNSTWSWMSTTGKNYKSFIYRWLAKGWFKYLTALLCNAGDYSTELDAMTFIQNELQSLSCCDSPSEYLRSKYYENVLANQHLSESPRSMLVYDNVTPKLEAWRSALHLVLLVLQTDAEIITGSAAQNPILNTGFLKAGYHLL